jgi:peptidyl-prolyl cis-trans isomerase C
MKLNVPVLTLAVAATLAMPAFAQNAAIVNGKVIPKSRVDEFVAALAQQGKPDTPELREQVREELIFRELMSQEAEKRGVAKNADVKRQLELVRQNVLFDAMIRTYLRDHPVKDEDIKAEYDRVAKQAGDKEFKVRHILVEKEETAKSLIDQIKKGGKFEELAKQSKDPGSAENGGDLDWARPATFVKPFSEAMTKLEKGKMTEEPVKSEYGYHVIRVDDVREAKPPAFEQVKPQIAQDMQRRKIAEFARELKEKSKIQ